MSFDCAKTTVGKFCPFIYGKALPERERKGGDVAVVSSAGYVGRHNTSLAAAGIVVGRKGTVGSVHLIDRPFWAIDTAFYVPDAPLHRDLYFTYHLLRTLGLEHLNSDSAVPGLNRDNAHTIEIFVPSLRVQQDIGRLAKSLDERIDRNRALAANLEAIARRLFKSWFVDFDPVRAKAAGEKPYGLADDIAALFPDRFVESELGEIPEGWNTARLADLVQVDRGLSYKGAGLVDCESGQPMHNLNSVLEGGGYKYAGIKFYSADYKERHIAKAGDIIVANTEQGHKHLLIGFPAIIPASYDEGLFSHHLYRVRLLQGAVVTKYWLYYALMAPDVRAQLIGHANGSTVNMLKPTGLQVPVVFLPPPVLCHHFEEIAKALHKRIEASIAESDVLADMRDILLPRLISGKLRVEDAESKIEEAIA